MRLILICFSVAICIALASAQRSPDEPRVPRVPQGPRGPRGPRGSPRPRGPRGSRVNPRCEVVDCPPTFAPTEICSFRLDRENNVYIYKDFEGLCDLKNWNCENSAETYIAFTAEGDTCADIGISQIKPVDIVAAADEDDNDDNDDADDNDDDDDDTKVGDQSGGGKKDAEDDGDDDDNDDITV